MKNKLLIGIILLASVVSLSLYFFIKEANSYTNIIKSNWDIEMLGEYEEIFRVDSGVGFQGDGDRYHIFEYNPKEDIIDEVEWKYDENKYVEQKISKIIERLNVPDEYLPSFKYKYKYYLKEENLSMIYIILNDDKGLIYVVEHFQ